MKTAGHVLGTLACVLLLAGCASTAPPPAQPLAEVPTEAATSSRTELRRLGEHFESAIGYCAVIRVQDEYRLIRCVETGWIQGCFDEILSVSTYDMPWSEWIDVQDPEADFQLKFVSPEDVAVRRIPRIVALR